MPQFLDELRIANINAVGSYGRVNPATRNDPTESPLVRVGKNILDSKPKVTPALVLPLTDSDRIGYDVLGFRERIDTCRKHAMPNCSRCA